MVPSEEVRRTLEAYSPKCLERLSEKGCEQPSKRGFRWCGDAKMGLKVPFRWSIRQHRRLFRPFSDGLGETVRKASSANQTPRHQTAHRYVDERFASLRQPLVVFAHPSVVVYPGERPLHYPPTW